MAEQRAVLVTGASSGIGRVIALRFGAAGWKVAINARRQARLNEVAKAITVAGGEAFVAPDNLTEFGAHERVVNDTLEHLGRLDVLVNNAGMGRFEAVEAVQDDSYDDQFKLNVWAPLAMVRAVVPHFKQAGGGQIINIGSIVGYVGIAEGSVYSASKWALRGLNECWREELYPHNIKVAYVAPGFVLSEFNGRTEAPASNPDASWAMVPDDVAHAVLCIATQGPNSDIREIVLQVRDRSP